LLSKWKKSSVSRRRRKAADDALQQLGGLKFMLNPIANEIDVHKWRRTEKDLFPSTRELHQLLQENSGDEKQYHRYMDSMKSSVRTAFYTPPTAHKSFFISFARQWPEHRQIPRAGPRRRLFPTVLLGKQAKRNCL
jgi:hypothetical protein